MKKVLRKYPFSCFVIALIWVACMMPVPETPLNNVAFIDKWTHFAMYGTLTITIMAEYGFRHKCIEWKRFSVGAIVCPVTMGGLVELAQAYLTNGVRSGDWLDFIANSTGVLLGCLIGIPLARFLSTR